MPTDRRLRRNFKTIGLASFAFISLIAAEPSSAEIKTITATGEHRADVGSSNDPISKSLRVGHTGKVWSVALSPDERTLASAGSDHTIKLWDIATGQVSRTLGGMAFDVLSVVMTHDGRWLASGSYDGRVRLWDIVTGQPPTILGEKREHSQFSR